MAEVGVLNLTIKDNSEQAGQGLNTLADALRRVKNAVSRADNLERYASALKSIAAAIESGANSYRTLGRLATSMEKVKVAATGFKMPDFSRLENLARSLQENFNAENGLKRIAEGMEAIKAASEGFKMPSMKDLEKMSAFMNGNMGAAGGGKVSAKDMAGMFGEAKERISEMETGIISANGQLSNMFETFRDGDSVGKEAESFQEAFSSFNNMRMMHALGSGQDNPFEQAEQSFASLKENAIEVEGTVSDSIGSFGGFLGDVAQNAEAVTENFENIENAAQGSANDVGALYSDVVAQYRQDMDELFEHITDMRATAARNDENGTWGDMDPVAYREGIAEAEDHMESLRQKWEELTGAQRISKEQMDAYVAAQNAATFQRTIQSHSDLRNKYAELEKIAQQAREAKEEIKNLIGSLNKPMDWRWLGDGINQMQGIGAASKNAEDSMNAFLKGMQGDDDTSQRLREMNPELAETAEKFDAAKDAAKEYANSAKDAERNSLGFKETITGMIDVMKTTVIGKLASQFARLAKRMAMRAIIKQVSKAFQEGVENVYRYNQAIGGSFSNDMDSAATSILQMKNAIGAALAPAIQMLIPFVQQLINGFIEVINVFNQFMAIMNGQTEWTRAVPYATKAFEDQKKSAKGAHDSMKDLLADWDELNIIQSNSSNNGSGSSGKATEDYSKMFEQVKTFDSGVMEIANIVKDVVNFALDHIAEILAIVNLIKWGIKMTKFSTAFAGTVGTILALAGTALIMGLVFDIVTNLDNQFLKTGNVGYLIGDILTTLLGGVIAKKVLTKVLGGSLANIAIPLALTVSAVASLVTLIGSTDTSALSPEALGLSAVSGLKVGAAAAYLAKTVLGQTLGKSLAGGAAVAVASFGVAVGIKTVVQAIKSGVTEETIKGAALSSLAIGIGAGLFAKLAGATMLGALAFGGAAAGVALLTIAAAIGIAAVLSTSKDQITWGSYSATEEQIKSFVKEKGFKADVSATLTLVDNTIKLLPSEREAIESDAAALIPTLQVIRYGLATEDTYTKLTEDLFGKDGEGGVIGRVKSYAKEQKTLIQTSFTLMPIVDEDGNIDKTATAEFMKEGISGWTEVEKYMGQIGTQLAEALKGKTKDGIKTFDDELILELTTKLSNVQRAISQSQISSEGIGGMMTSLTGVTHETFDQALSVWDDYKNQLKDKYSATLQEELTSYQSLAAFYAARGNEGDDKLAKYYQDKADELVDMWDDRLNYAMYEMTKPGRDIFRKAILEMLNVEVTNDDITSALTESGFANYEMDNFIASLFDTNGNIASTSNERFEKYLQDILKVTFGDNYNTIQSLINSGALEYADLIPKEMISQIAEGFLKNVDDPKVRQAWNTFIDSYYKEKPVIKPEVTVEPNVTVKEAVDDATTTGGESVIETTKTVEKIVSDTKDATVAVQELENTTNNLVLDDITLNTSGVEEGTEKAATAVENMAKRIRNAFATLDGLSYEMDISGKKYSGAMKVLVPEIEQRAMGGPVRSGDLVMANENGNFELMGKMGNQPVVANNQQIVNGISQGVATANGDVVSELRVLTNLMQRMLQKEFVARAVPGSDWGQHNSRSGAALDRVTG